MGAAPPMDVAEYLKAKAGSTPPMDPAKYLEEKTGIAQKPAATTMQALFPRATEAKGAGKTALGAGLDALTSIIRVPAAGAAAAAEKMGLTSDKPEFGKVPAGTTFTGALDKLNQGKNEWGDPSLIAHMGQDPATVPTSLMPVAKLGQGASWLSRIGQGAASGAQVGGVSAAMHQAENYIQEKGLSLEQAAKEIGSGWASGRSSPALGRPGKPWASR